jgi:hypothetical protein
MCSRNLITIHALRKCFGLADYTFGEVSGFASGAILFCTRLSRCSPCDDGHFGAQDLLLTQEFGRKWRIGGAVPVHLPMAEKTDATLTGVFPIG